MAAKTTVKKEPDISVTPAEWDILDLLWEHDTRPMGSAELMELAPGRQFSPATVYLLLTSLEKKRLIEVVGHFKATRVKARLFKATLRREEFYALAHRQYFEKMRDGTVKGFMSALANAKSDEPEVVAAEVEEWLKDFKKKRKQQEDESK